MANIEAISLDTAKNKLRGLKQQTIWQAGRAAGSWLLFDFGKKLQRPDGLLVGEWSLAIYAPWIIKTDYRAIVSSNDDQKLIDASIEELVGSSLVFFQILPPAFDARFWFTNAQQIRIFPVTANSKYKYGFNSYWTFRKNTEFIIAFKEKNTIIYEELDRPI